MRSDITASDRTNRNVFTEMLPFFLFLFLFSFFTLLLSLSLLYIYIIICVNFVKGVKCSKCNRSIEDRVSISPMYRMYRILEIEGEGNRDESDAALVERYAFYAEDREAFSASFSPRIRRSIQGRRGKSARWKMNGSMNDRIERDIAYQREGRTERLAGKRSSILENRKNVDYIPFFEPCLNKEARLSN